MIDKLTPEQEALIPVYREKWRAIALSTKPIDRAKASDAVKGIYAAIGKQEPKIVFFDSPHAAHKNRLSLDSLPYSLYDLIRLEVRIAIKITLGSQLNIKLWEKIGKLFTIEFDSCFSIQIGNEIIGEIIEKEEEAVETEAYFWGVIMQEDLAE